MTDNKRSLTLEKSILGELPSQSGLSCRYGIFARHGGVSEGPYASLNVGVHVGDEVASVAGNRRLVREAMGISALLSARQVHGQGVFCLTEPLGGDLEVDGFDALVTNLAGVGLTIQQADCQAILLFDPRQQVIGAVHCGWRGSVQQIIPRVVEVMVRNYGTLAADLQAIISPSLGPCCAEFVNYHKELPEVFHPFMVRDNHFDFWGITRMQLTAAGVAGEHIRVAGLCTCCSDDYFSHRRATRQGQGLTGRNCSVVALVRQDA